MEPSLRASLESGLLSSLVGVVYFATVHWYFVYPILDTLVLGLFFAWPVGLAAGWAFERLARMRALARYRLDGPMFGIVMLAAMLPGAAAASVYRIGDPRSFTATDVPIAAAALLLSFPAGAAIAYAFERRREAALAAGTAALGVSLSIGHNVPVLGGLPVAGKMYAVIASTVVLASVVLAESRRLLLARRPGPSSP
jgi:hypothetical protein